MFAKSKCRSSVTAAGYPELRAEALEGRNLLAAPDLIADSLLGTDLEVFPGQQISISWMARNLGDVQARDLSQAVMWSSDSRIRVAEDVVIGFPSKNAGLDLAPGASIAQAYTLFVPTDAPVGSQYYLGIIADYEDWNAESNEANNDDGVPLRLSIVPAPDDSIDFNGNWSSAPTIAIDNATGDGVVAGMFERLDDGDVFKFTAAGSGIATISLDANPVLEDAAPAMVAYDSSFKMVGWIEYYDELTMRFEVAAGNTYYVYTWIPSQNLGRTGAYSLWVEGPVAGRTDDHSNALDWSNASVIPIDQGSGDGSLRGAFNFEGDNDLLKFTAKATSPVTLSVDLLAPAWARVVLYDSEYSQLAVFSGTEFQVASRTFAASGGSTYYVLIEDGSADELGSYRVIVDGFGSSSFNDDLADAREWEAARLIQPDSRTGDGYLRASLETAGDTDLIGFVAAEDGDTTLLVQASHDVYTYIQLFDGNRSSLDSGWTGADGKKYFNVMARRGDSFYLLITPQYGDDRGSYEVVVDGVQARDEHAGSGYWKHATPLSVDPNTGNGGRVGEVEAAGDSDLFKFVAAGSGAATITLDVGAGFDGWFEVYDANRSFLGRQNSKAAGVDEARSLTLTANATYYVLVGGWRMPGGSYNLMLDGAPAPDDHADAGAWTAATSIGLNTSGDGARSGAIEADRDTDLFRITAAKNGLIAVTLDTGIGFDGWIEIYDSAYKLVARRNVGAAGVDENVSFQSSANQTYFILIGGWRVGGGSYNLMVNS